MEKKKIYSNFHYINVNHEDINEVIKELIRARNKGAKFVDCCEIRDYYGDRQSAELETYTWRMETDDEFESRRKEKAAADSVKEMEERDRKMDQYMKLKEDLGM